MKFKDINDLMLKKEYDQNYNVTWRMGYNKALNQQGEKEIELDLDKVRAIMLETVGGEEIKLGYMFDVANALKTNLHKILKVKEKK